MTNPDHVFTAIASAPVVPVLVVPEIADAEPLAAALVAGGMTAVEVTLRTGSAMNVIEAMKAAEPGLLVGAGTVLNEGDLSACLKAGADFVVSPGITPALQEALLDTSIAALPGISTASEAIALYDAGFSRLKFFPAEACGGAPFLKALQGPLPHISFMPTGGITPINVTSYLQLPNVFAVGGSWIVSKQDLAAKNWQGIQDKAAQALKENTAFKQLLSGGVT